MEEWILLTWDTTTIQGDADAIVIHGRLTMVAASTHVPRPKNVNERNQKWSVFEKPKSSTRVWIGSLDGVIWDGGPERMSDELPTFEERTCPRVPGDVLQYKNRKDHSRRGKGLS